MVERNISEKDKCLDKVFWFKVILGLIAGVSYGAFGMTGFMSCLLYFVVSTVSSFMFFKRFVNSDEEVDYQSEIFIEGLNVSVPLFILTWTFVHTLLQINAMSAQDSSTLA
mmetsp:Transcript_13782/g.14333  ORF Transcript_13782/g.14333 Transcript_13782/m.14333 type:complete len:111 (-) Transcript_13782:63-395(-)